MNKILVTGGAGYIGSITCRILKDAGLTPIIFDNLSTGHIDAVQDLEVHEGSLLDYAAIDEVMKKVKPDAIIHFAAFSLVGESMEKPSKYFENNVCGSVNLFKAALSHKVNKLVFSSSAAVYGKPAQMPISEYTPTGPINPYGESKLMIEKILDSITEEGLNSIRLRYFNVAGALADGSMGEDHRPETHILPIAIQTALGSQDSFTIYGDDYQTRDGTCVRDYVHVVDLANAHLAALKKLETSAGSAVYNVGVGEGYSNKQILEMVREVTGKKFKVVIGERRKGDPDSLFTDGKRIREDLGWQPQFGLKEIVESAVKWHIDHPKGYGK